MEISALSPPKEKSKASNGHAASGNGSTANNATEADQEVALCDLRFKANCQSCTKWYEQANGEDEEDDDNAWMSHALSFAKDRLGKSLVWKRKNEEEILVIDSKEKEVEIKEGKKKDRHKGRGNERDGEGWGRDEHPGLP